MNWWKNFKLDPARWAHWRVGPLSLFARGTNTEVVFAWQSGADPLDNSLSIDLASEREPDRETFEFGRYAVANETMQIQLLPMQPDRAFVVRPEMSLSLPAGEHLLLFVSTPVWVSVSLTGSPHESLFATPSFRASDTWFGPNTLDGELCYSSKTLARTDVSDISVRPHRATTPIEIRNNGEDTLLIEQLRVPLPALAIYQGDDSRLWTDTVSLVREEDESSASMTVAANRSVSTAQRSLICEPRAPLEPGSIISAFSKLLT